jgi:WD40 repeat protein
LAGFALYQLQQVHRQRVEQLAITAKVLLATEPVTAMVNALVAYGLSQSAFVQFPNQPRFIAAEGSLLEGIQRNSEQNRLQHTDSVNSAAFSPDGKMIVTGRREKNVRLWDATTGKPMGPSLLGHTEAVSSVAFSPDGKMIVSGGGESTVRLWDVTTRKPIGPPLLGHTEVVSSVAFSPDGKMIVSGGGESTVRLWAASPKNWLHIACLQLQHHPILTNPSPDLATVAGEAKQTCEPSWK